MAIKLKYFKRKKAVKGRVLDAQEADKALICLNRKLSTHTRSQSRIKKKAINALEKDFANKTEDIFPDVAELVIRKERQEAINLATWRAIRMLLPRQQDLVKKVHFEERTLASIAQDEGVTYQSIQDRLEKIYNKLRKILGDKNPRHI